MQIGGEIIKTTVLTPYGKTIKKRLIDMNRTQAWLIERVRQTTELYFDRSYLSKIQTGKLATPKIISAINEILNLSDTSEKEGAV